jgi:hypothetical protein
MHISTLYGAAQMADRTAYWRTTNAPEDHEIVLSHRADEAQKPYLSLSFYPL